MKLLAILLAFFFPLALSAPGAMELTEEEFESYFNLPKITDPEELAKREEALKEAEAMIEEENEEFQEGKKTWFDELNEFSDLPQDEFEKHKTGELKPEGVDRKFGLGALEPQGAERVDAESERYFANFRESMRTNRASVPNTYNSVSLGHVSEVKNQKDCGSCVAFSNMAAIETCFKRVTGAFSDFSEQQLVDCGYGKNGANGCDGAYTYAYIKYLADTGMDLLAEATYPYKNEEPALKCPRGLPSYNRGAKITSSWYTYNGDEDTLKGLVAKHGAVVTSVAAYGPMQEYKGGIFSGCTTTKTDHAVTVVGYGSEGGVDYWLIKNSWGSNWGENGYIRLQRGVGMCGVGKAQVVVECAPVAGPTSATLTTEAPCDDVYSNCGDMAHTSCYRQDIKTNCPKSCGLCKGMTPVSSNTCYDEFNNCADMAKTACYQDHISSKCKKSCGLCAGMTPARSYTCYDQFSNCHELCRSAEYANNQCKKACGKC